MVQPALTRYNASELPTISLVPHSVREIQKERETTIFTSPSNVEQRLAFDQYSPKKWTIHIPAMTVAQLESFWTFWDGRNGEAKPFKWVNVLDDNTYYVRFATAKPKFTQVLPLRFSGSFVLCQVSDLEINEAG